MHSVNLIERENEFKKLNKQLEKKTESLMKEIENEMAKKDIFSDFSCNLKLSPKYSHQKKHFCDSSSSISKESTEADKMALNPQQNLKKQKATTNNLHLECKKDINKIETTEYVNGKQCHCCVLSPNKMNEDLEFLYAFVSVSIKDNILPQSFMKDKINFESVCKCLSTKLKLLEEQIEKLKTNITLKTKQCDLHMNQIADLESTKMNLLNTANTMKSETADMKAKYAVMQNRLNKKDKLHKEQRIETDKVTSELKKLKSRNTNLEARCASQEEFINNLKQQIQTAKLSEKEFRESSRIASVSHQNAISRLECRVKGLVATIDKQALLIDNLRRQNALLATEGALRALEKDYNDFLNQDF